MYHRNASGSDNPCRSINRPFARSIDLRASSRSVSEATSASSAANSVNRDTAISTAGTRSLFWNGLTRYAIAPAARARSTRSRWLNAVRITTGASRDPAIFSAAASPSMIGILMSMITRSGRSSSASRTAASPSPASPTTS